MTTRKTIYLCCLITRPENGGRGGGAYSRGVYFKFRPIGGLLIPRERYFEVREGGRGGER